MGKWLKDIISVAILAFLVWYLYDHRDQLRGLLKMNAHDMAFLYVLTAAGTINNSFVAKMLVGRFRKAPGLVEMTALQNATRLLNYVPMKFGSLFRARYLKRRCGLAYTHYIAVVTYIVLLTAMAAGAIGLTALLMGYGVAGRENQLLAVLFAGLLAASIFFTFVPLPTMPGDGLVGKLFNRFSAAKQSVLRNPLIAGWCLGQVSLSFLLTSLRLWIIYNSLDVDIAFGGYLVLGAVGFGAAVMGLTPGALGVRELRIGAASVVLAVPLEVGIMAAMFDRAIMLSWTFTVGVVCTIWFWRKSPSDFKKNGLSGEIEGQETGVETGKENE